MRASIQITEEELTPHIVEHARKILEQRVIHIGLYMGDVPQIDSMPTPQNPLRPWVLSYEIFDGGNKR